MSGWPLLVHYCGICHYNTAVDYAPDVWTRNHGCSHCGLSTSGADLAGSSGPVEMNQTQHDELVALFSQAMQVSQQQPQHSPQTAVQQQQQQPTPQPSEKTPIHFVSAHYYPNPHTATALHIPTSASPSPPPPYQEIVSSETLAGILRQHGIDPEALLPDQIQLFANAGEEQRRRLMELWRIAPPGYPPLHTGYGGRQEMQMEAETPQQQQHQQGDFTVREDHDLDTYIPTPITPIREHGETAWPPAARMKAASIAAAGAAHSRSQSRNDDMAEPYMQSLQGYRGAVDPVYAGGYVGMHDQIRNHADWERRNEMLARERGGDWEMEM